VKRFFLIVILSMFILSACVPEAEQTPTPVEQVNAVVEHEATKTPVSESTDTPQPEMENTEETIEPTATDTPTMTATPNPFANARIISYGYLKNNRLLVTIEVPGGTPDGEFTVFVGEVEYICEVLSAFPDRLYCNGPALPGGEKVIVRVLSGEICIFAGSFSMPMFNSGTPSSEGNSKDESLEGQPPPDDIGGDDQ
jgi:hypothetical protein